MAIRAARAAAEKQGTAIVILKVEGLIAICDYFVLVTGSSDRQLRAIGEAIEEDLRQDGIKARRREGERELDWLLLDFIDIVVHVFDEEARVYYELERLWRDAESVEWENATDEPAREASQR